MAIVDTVNRIFREFKRYTGDGLPGEPSGAPLPVGDPQSGVHSPKKSELRAGFTDILGELDDATEEARAEADRAQTEADRAQEIADGIGSVSVPDGSITPPKFAPGVAGASGLALLATTTNKQASQIIVGDTHIDVEGLYKTGSRTDAQAIQAAFDDAPIGAALHFTPRQWNIGNNPLVMSKVQKVYAKGAAMWALGLGAGSDLLTVKIQTAGMGNTNGREFKIEGGNWYTNTGRHVFRLLSNIGATGSSTDATGLPLINAIVTETICESVDHAIRITGIDNHFIKVDKNCIHSGVRLDFTADGNQITNNLIAGPNTGIVVDLVAGAFNTLVTGNAIVATNGGLDIQNGDMVIVENNQFEHGNPAITPVIATGSHILIRGGLRIARNNRIRNNNFGAGAKIQTSITLWNARYTEIDGNQFNVAVAQDINFANVIGVGSEARYNVVGAKNGYRGTRAMQSPASNVGTDIGRRLVVNDQGVGNRGIWKAGALLSPSASWGFSNCRWMITEDGNFRADGTWTVGTVTAGTVIGAMPVGARPQSSQILPIATDSGAPRPLFVASTGNISLADTFAGATAYPASVRFEANWLDTYETGPA